MGLEEENKKSRVLLDSKNKEIEELYIEREQNRMNLMKEQDNSRKLWKQLEEKDSQLDKVNIDQRREYEQQNRE